MGAVPAAAAELCTVTGVIRVCVDTIAIPRIGRVKVAHGADAVDGAFATIYGEANLTAFEVWAYQVNPLDVSVGDPVDLSKRLDGSPTVRLT